MILVFMIKLLFAASAVALGTIFGVTHSEDGQPIIRLTKAYKVSIGIPATDERKYPQKSDHFHIRAKNRDGEWVDDIPLMNELRQKLPDVDTPTGKAKPQIKEVEFALLADAIEEVFRTELSWYGVSERKCHGDGHVAERKVTALPEKDRAQYKDQIAIQWKPCGKGCPQFESGECKPNGELTFILKDRPIMGSVATFSTTSYESIRRIHSSLLQIQSLTGGRLRGIPLRLVMRPGKTRYEQDGKVKTGSAFFVNVEFRQQDYSKLVPDLLQYSIQYEKSLHEGRKLIAQNVDEEEETFEVEPTPEAEQAKAMTDEFYPDNRTETPPAAPPAPPPPTPDDDAIIARIFKKFNLNPVQQGMLLQSLKGDVSAARNWLEIFEAGIEPLKLTRLQLLEVYARTALAPNTLKASLAEIWKQRDPANVNGPKSPADAIEQAEKAKAKALKKPEPPKPPLVPPVEPSEVPPKPAATAEEWNF